MTEYDFQTKVLAKLDKIGEDLNDLSTRSQLHEQRTETDRGRIDKIEARIESEQERNAKQVADVKASASAGRRVLEVEIEALKSKASQLEGALAAGRWVLGASLTTGGGAAVAQVLQALGAI